MSSAVVPSRASRRSSHSSAGVTAGSCSRSLWTSWTAKACENGALLQQSERPPRRPGRAARREQDVGDRVRLAPARRPAPRRARPGAAGFRPARRAARSPAPRARRSSGAGPADRRGRSGAASRARSGCRCARRTTRPARRRADSPRALRRRAWAARDRTPAGGPPGSRGPAPRRCGSCSAATRPRERPCGSGGSPPRSPDATGGGPARSRAAAGAAAARASSADGRAVRPRAPCELFQLLRREELRPNRAVGCSHRLSSYHGQKKCRAVSRLGE